MSNLIHNRAGSASKYIAMSDAIKRKLGSRATIYRWIYNGFVRSTYLNGRRYVSLDDLEYMARLRETGSYPVLNTDAATAQIANRLAALVSVMTDTQKQQLVDMLLDNRDVKAHE